MKRTTQTWLALDQGGQASRAILFDDQGQELAQARVAVGTTRSGDARVEHDPGEIVASLRTAAARALAARGAAPWPTATGLATQRSSIVCWRRGSGEPLSPVLSWQDRRASAALAPLREREAAVRRLSGLPLSAHYGATKIRWCVEHLPAVRSASEHGDLVIGPLATFLASRLIGRTAGVDPANASRTQLWDAARNDWSPELLALFGVEREWLPEPGFTTLDAAITEGLGPGARLAVVTGDQSAVPFAWGPPREDVLYLNLGTGAFLQRTTGTRRPDPGALLGSVLYGDARGTLYSHEGTVNGAASAIEWLVAKDGLDPGAAWRGWETAQHAAGDGHDLLFLNGVAGLGSPFWRSDFTPRFLGSGDSSARFAALVSSIAFLVRENFDALGQSGALAGAIVTGGLARSDRLVQLIADLCGIPCLRPAQSEATARGVFGLLTAGRTCAAHAAEGRRFTPQRTSGAEAAFRRWRAALHAALRG